jgi:hypothetical protein
MEIFVLPPVSPEILYFHSVDTFKRLEENVFGSQNSLLLTETKLTLQYSSGRSGVMSMRSQQ